MELAINVITGMLSALLAGGVTWYVMLRKVPHEIKVLDSEESENLATTLNLVVQSLTNTITTSNAERKDLVTRIDELEAHRDVRSREIYTLQQNLERLNRDYAREVNELNNKIRIVEAQANEWGKKYERLKQYTEKLRQALKEAGLEVPEMSAELLDTLDKIRLPKAGRTNKDNRDNRDSKE